MIVLQNFMLPEPGICTEQDLYFRRHGPVAFSQTARTLELKEGAVVSFNTYFNALSIGKWQNDCDLDDLYLEITGSGRVEIKVFHAQPHESWELLNNETTTLEDSVPLLLDLSVFKEDTPRGMIYAEVRALEDDVLVSGHRYITRTPARQEPKLAISITTFKREEEVRRTVSRLDAFIAAHPDGNNMHVQVVDNGQSAEIAPTERVTPILNENLGGAGGFARGLREAEDKGFTHVLFMDDDASFHMENIHRAYAYLSLAKRKNAAVAGAMINNTHKWCMWEAGAFFDGTCKPLHMGRDLRDWGQIMVMEDEGLTHFHPTMYGGWWFFAFPVSEVKHHPFPFFVRGDDISFSLANDFSIRVLNGVVSFQDDFTEKESAQTLYLDLRNHLLHHLVFDELKRSGWGVNKVSLFFLARALMRFHYETAEALLMAIEDVMRGPDFFDEHADMAQRRADIKALIKKEAWRDVSELDLKQRRGFFHKSARFKRAVFYPTLNGHLFPFYRKFADRLVLNMGERGLLGPAYGAHRVTYLNSTGLKGYTVQMERVRAFKLGVRMIKLLRKFAKEHDRLRAEYRKGYDKLTTEEYWDKKLKRAA